MQEQLCLCVSCMRSVLVPTPVHSLFAVVLLLQQQQLSRLKPTHQATSSKVLIYNLLLLALLLFVAAWHVGI